MWLCTTSWWHLSSVTKVISLVEFPDFHFITNFHTKLPCGPSMMEQPERKTWLVPSEFPVDFQLLHHWRTTRYVNGSNQNQYVNLNQFDQLILTLKSKDSPRTLAWCSWINCDLGIFFVFPILIQKILEYISSRVVHSTYIWSDTMKTQ